MPFSISSNTDLTKFSSDIDSIVGKKMIFSRSNPPFISKISTKPLLPQNKPRFQVSQTKSIEVEGSFFTPNVVVESDGFTVKNLQFINENKIVLTVTSLEKTGIFDLKFNNGLETIATEAIIVESAPWVDLRSDSKDTFELGTELVLSSKVTPVTSSLGTWFQNSRAWRSSAAFEKYKFVRGERKTVEIIFNNYNRKYAVGIGKNPRNIRAGSQFYQAEIVLLFQNNYSFYGLYGNRNRQEKSRELDPGGWLKAKFTEDASFGSSWYLYRLDSIEEDNWNDESNLIVSGEIDDRFKLEGEELFPFIIPQSDLNNYMTAFRVF